MQQIKEFQTKFTEKEEEVFEHLSTMATNFDLVDKLANLEVNNNNGIKRQNDILER